MMFSSIRSHGQPVHSASLAMILSRQALESRGIGYADREITVSFCDDVYTVVSKKPSDMPLERDFKVEINAKDGGILSAKTDE